MDDKNGKSPLLALTVATMLFAAMGVIVYTQAPYKGIRPSIPEIREPSEKVRARLWQDPFQAVLDHDKAKPAGKKPDSSKNAPAPQSSPVPCISITKSPSLEKKLHEEIGKRAKVTVLAVMVLGGPYDDDIEFRIRQRYAALSALNVLGYHPDDPTHIDFLRICQPSPQNQQNESQLSLTNIIPFEWLSNDKNASVLLLWLTDESFQEDQLSQLEFLRDNIGKELPFKIIGPATSTTLLKMIEEGKETKLEIYSATATVDNKNLMEKARNEKGEKIDPKKFLESGYVLRTILPDEKLAEALSKELKNRGIKDQDHIVLVAEWDTEYGRLLPQKFKDVFARDFFPKNVAERVHRFSYLRGIDGKLPGEQDSGAKDQKKNDSGSKNTRDIKSLEEPLGKSQYDYLRRLAERIGHLEDKYGRGAIRAIGVLGNDFYDKFLVLQALGQRFPDAIFFTTDLDARYLHPANIEWTRNLLVASTFGLQLRDDLQRDVPPFRDAYQTSVFAATLRAFNFAALKDNDFIKLKPRIFEIGRHHAIDLSDQLPLAAAPINQAFPKEGFPLRDWMSFFFILALGAVLAIILWLSHTSETGLGESAKQFFQKTLTIPIIKIPVKIYVIWITALAAISLIILAFHAVIMSNFSEEPLSFTEGVSVWPSEFLRFLAIILSLVFLKLSSSWVNKNNDSIAKEFAFTSKTPLATEDANYVNIKWAKYLDLSKKNHRFIPILIIVVLYVIFSMFIILTFEKPTTPVRGTISLIINNGLLFFTIILFLFLTFFVLDTIMICQRFIAQFYDTQPQWQTDSLKRFLQKQDNDPDLSKWREGGAEDALGNWMLIQLIARRTDVVGKLIFFPFIVWFLMFASRLHYFDNWRTPPGLAIVISMSAVLAWGCAVYLRRSAEKLRAVVINRLDQQLVGTYAAGPENKAYATCIQYVLNEVKAVKTGAFASYLQQPALQSLLVPIGGISGLKVLELLSNLG
jgi:hypothetical protein